MSETFILAAASILWVNLYSEYSIGQYSWEIWTLGENEAAQLDWAVLQKQGRQKRCAIPFLLLSLWKQVNSNQLSFNIKLVPLACSVYNMHLSWDLILCIYTPQYFLYIYAGVFYWIRTYEWWINKQLICKGISLLRSSSVIISLSPKIFVLHSVLNVSKMSTIEW